MEVGNWYFLMHLHFMEVGNWYFLMHLVTGTNAPALYGSW